MSLQLILGGSGSGKSYWLYTSLIREAMQHPQKKYLVIVPEQFTMQTQRELVKLHPAHGILNIDVLSFERLAHRVSEETGEDQRTVLTETGKNLLLRRVAARKKDQLQIMGNRLNQPGCLSEIKSLLSELMQYGISQQELEAMIELSGERPRLQYKLKDMQVLYQGFEELKQDRFITAEELLDIFCQAAPGSATLRGCEIVFDGFTGFTPVQQKALEVILRLAARVRVAVTLDGREHWSGRLQEHELFFLSKKTIRTLEELAQRTGTELEDPVILGEGSGRFAQSPGLAFLEHQLFRYGRRNVWKKASDPDISVHTALNPAAELRFAARTICRLTREQGIRYREIGIITGDLASYGNYVKKIFDEYGIPCFLDQTVQILQNPCLEFIRGAFGVIQYGFSYESVFRLLRTRYAGLTAEETDRLENYVLATGIRGKKSWKQEWTRRTARMSEEEPTVCEEYRNRLMKKLSPWLDMAEKKEAPLQEYAAALYELLVSCSVQEQLNVQAQQFAEQGQMERAKEYEQIFETIVDLLDEAAELLGDEIVSRKEFCEILEAGFAEARVGIIPPGIDEVHVGDMQRTRLNHIKVLFFLGVNDGWIPAREGKGGIVSEMEREFLQSAGVELAPTERENSYIQRFYLYLGMTKPSRRLYLSFCRCGSDGKGMRPSYLIHTVCRLFPDLVVTDEDAGGTALEQVASMRTGFSFLAEGLRRIRGEDRAVQSAQIREVFRQYVMREESRRQALELLDAAFLVADEKGLRSATARELYGEELVNSVTRLEQFASCAFAHFAAYGLELQERERFHVRSVDIGTVIHRALERFSEKLERSRYTWFDVPDEVRDRLMEASVEETVADYGEKLFFDSARNQHMIDRMKRILRRSVWALHQQVRAGSFVPRGFEVAFQAVEDLEAVNIALSGQEKMRLKGRIDRVDVCEDETAVYVKVVDYKSGNTSFDLVSLYYGLQLQLVVYLNAAMEMEKRLHPDKQVIPAGIFYYRVKDPMLDGSREQTPEEINQEILKKLRMDGIVNSDPGVIDRLDRDCGSSSSVIPAGRKADGSLSALSSAASTERLDELSDFVQGKLQTLGKEILSGKISAHPYRRKQRKACDYCVFSDLCGFDPGLPGAKYRELADMDREQVWAKIEEEEQEQGEENTEM